MLDGHIAIVGFGPIGQRHLESCRREASDRSVFHVVTQAYDYRQNGARWDAGAARGGKIEWHSRVENLPRQIDAAIVATRADIRAHVMEQLLSLTTVRHLLLEKVLFQTLAEYPAISDRLTAVGAHAWVNCARRCWAGYREVQKWLQGKKIVDLRVSGDSWDIGCNAIHYLDLLAFLIGATEVSVDSVDITDASPARRAGMLHLEGWVAGMMEIAGITSTPYTIVSAVGGQRERIVGIKLADGVLRCIEHSGSMTVFYPDGRRTETPIPLQSQITGGLLEDMIESDACALPSYAESRMLHEPLIGGLLNALEARSLIAEPGRCPVT